MSSLTLTSNDNNNNNNNNINNNGLSLNSLSPKTNRMIIEGAKTKQQLIELYDFGKVIGTGGSSTVRLVRLKDSSKELRALKIIQKNLVQDKIRLQREVIVQKNCKNSSIVKIFDVFESNTEIYIVLEYMQGGELYDVILDKGKLIEQEAQVVALQVLKGIAYMEDHGIIHRDIKPENILLYQPFTNNLNDIIVKLSDFGSSRYLIDNTPPQSPAKKNNMGETSLTNTNNSMNLNNNNDHDKSNSSTTFNLNLKSSINNNDKQTTEAAKVLTQHIHQKPRRGSRTDQLKKESSAPMRRRAYSAVFTDYFIAPEVLVGKGYDGKIDMWSMGVVIYILLSGFPPFFDDKDGNIEVGTSLKQRILNGQFGFPSPYWDDISENAKHLIRRMLSVDPKRRINAKEAILHPFFNKRTLSMEELERNFQTIKLEQQQKNNLRNSFSSTYSDTGSDKNSDVSNSRCGNRKRTDSDNSNDSNTSNNSTNLTPRSRKTSAERRRKRVDTPVDFGE